MKSKTYECCRDRDSGPTALRVITCSPEGNKKLKQAKSSSEVRNGKRDSKSSDVQIESKPEMISRRDILMRAKKCETEIGYQRECPKDEDDIWMDKEKLFKDHIQEVLDKWEQIDDEIWAKIICMEKNRRVAKAYARLPYLVVDGSESRFDGIRLGLKSFENANRSDKTKDTLDSIGEGVKFKMDEKGNIFVKRLGRGSVFVRSLIKPDLKHAKCIGKDILDSKGKLEHNKTINLFDMKTFQDNIAAELKEAIPERRRLESQCICCIVFGKDGENLLESSSWMMMINIVALEYLRSEMPRKLSVAVALNNNNASRKGSETSNISKCIPPTTTSPSGLVERKGRSVVHQPSSTSLSSSSTSSSMSASTTTAECGHPIAGKGSPSKLGSETQANVKVSEARKQEDKIVKSSGKPATKDKSRLKSVIERKAVLYVPDPDYDFEEASVRSHSFLRKEDPYYCGLSAKITNLNGVRNKRNYSHIGVNKLQRQMACKSRIKQNFLINRFYSCSSSDSSPSSCETSYSTIYNSISESSKVEAKNVRY